MKLGVRGRKARRKQLIDVAIKVFAKKGYSAVSVNDIIAAPGVERQEIGADESWQIEYIPGRFERLQHGRKRQRRGKRRKA